MGVVWFFGISLVMLFFGLFGRRGMREYKGTVMPFDELLNSILLQTSKWPISRKEFQNLVSSILKGLSVVL